jgi:hypothetical protein
MVDVGGISDPGGVGAWIGRESRGSGGELNEGGEVPLNSSE